MKSIDREIAEVERAIAARKVAMRMTAQATKTRTKQVLTSPVALGAAAVAGFFLAGGLWRRKKHERAAKAARAADRRRASDKDTGKGVALGTLAMTGITWLMRSQFGGPAGLAHFVLEKIREAREQASPQAPVDAGSRPAATGAPAQIPR